MINLFFIGLIICLIYLFLEYYTLSALLKKIPIRILVNGTRGKSTTVRILYQILDRQKYRVYAKTTGNRPEILEPDGYIRFIKRHAPANIAENILLLRKWVENKTDAVVLEGMALHPEMQRTLSRFIFHPTHTIITNILSDHQEIMGESLIKNARVISASINQNTTLFISQSTDDLLRASGIQKSNRVLCEEHRFSGDFKNIPGEILNQSWSIVRSVSENIGWQQKHTAQCFVSVWKSVDRYIKWDLADLHTEFWNLFSVNDIHTASQFIDHRLAKSVQPVTYVLLLNCRTDRPLRTKYFIGLIAEKYTEAEVWLTGSGRHLALHLLKKRLPDQAIYTGRIEQVLTKIKNGFSVKTLLFGIGNFKGMETLIQRIEILADSIQS